MLPDESVNGLEANERTPRSRSFCVDMSKLAPCWLFGVSFTNPSGVSVTGSTLSPAFRLNPAFTKANAQQELEGKETERQKLLELLEQFSDSKRAEIYADGKKSLDLANGTIGYRQQPGSIEVSNDTAALASLSLPAATTIGGHAFEQCPLETVSLPAAVTLGGNAFGDCSVLETLNLPALTTIGDGAFTGCAALKTTSLPKAAVIGTYAFATTALASIDLPAATVIGEGAFQNCAARASANLPAAAAIGTNAFYSCTALASLTLGTALPTFGNPSVFYNVGKDTEEGFTICVPDETAQAALETAIATTGNWHTALTDTTWRGIYQGNFKGVEVTQ
jgi:hypothetical protein